MQHVFDLWAGSPSKQYRNSRADRDSYQPGTSFVDLKATLPSAHKAWAKVEAIEPIWPTNP